MSKLDHAMNRPETTERDPMDMTSHARLQEIRKLREERDEFAKRLHGVVDKWSVLHAQRDELLIASREVLSLLRSAAPSAMYTDAYRAMAAAIKACK